MNWQVSHRIAKEFEELRPDIIHINKQNLEDGLDLLRAVRSCAIPSVCTIHLTHSAGYLRARGGYLRDRIARHYLRKYPGMLVAVQEARRIVLDQFLGRASLTRTVYNGVPRVDLEGSRYLRDATRNELGLSDSDILILGLGRMVPQKRPLLFLQIAEELHKRLPATKFVWVGDGSLAEEWSKAIHRNELHQIVRCVGWQADVLPYLRASDMLLHVAEFEGLPFGVIEAMSAGLACAIDKDLVREIPFFNAQNTLLTDDIEALAAVLQDRKELSSIAERGRRLVDETFSLEQMATGYEQIYREAKSVFSSLH
jgi:glycosyltransferase involved in cell wall biosynthesis